MVLTLDLHPVCRHEPNVINTTDALAVFPDLIRSHTIDGFNETGIFVSDMTLAQVGGGSIWQAQAMMRRHPYRRACATVGAGHTVVRLFS